MTDRIELSEAEIQLAAKIIEDYRRNEATDYGKWLTGQTERGFKAAFQAISDERRKAATRGASVTAGPFGRSEQDAIRDHYNHLQQAREHLSGLRVEALRFALNPRDLQITAAEIVGRAEEFYQFLSRQP